MDSAKKNKWTEILLDLPAITVEASNPAQWDARFTKSRCSGDN